MTPFHVRRLRSTKRRNQTKVGAAPLLKMVLPSIIFLYIKKNEVLEGS